MAGGFTPEFLEELKYKCDIVEVISQYVPLQKKGGRYFGCCPFHNEKTPSFCVNNGWYHCFGCGASGDVVKFVMEMESVSFYDAVKILADKVGLQLPEVKLDPQYAQKKEHGDVLKQLMRDAARYYRNNLLDEKKGKDAREYLHNRGLDDEIAKRYGLGCRSTTKVWWDTCAEKATRSKTSKSADLLATLKDLTTLLQTELSCRLWTA